MFTCEHFRLFIVFSSLREIQHHHRSQTS
jgi:hypothetical protein